MKTGFPNGFVEDVRNAGDIVRVVSDYVPLRPSGARLKGLCPFHQEKTPSFSVDPTNQLFYCFGCQTGGDLFAFVQLYEKVNFPEAVEMLARRWGIPLPESGSRKDDDPRERVLELNHLAVRFWRAQLEDPQIGRRGRDYLERRGIDVPTAERLGIGLAPDGWTGLMDHLTRQRAGAPEDWQRAGLVVARRTGEGFYDRFRDRLIFPIRDAQGRPIAFGGRALGDAEPKYLNSPETPVYTKGDHLYGLDLAREAIRREGRAIVVEGYLDLAALVQAGFSHVVASLGTSFTPAQARLLQRFTERIVFSYDGDSAGAQATERSLGLLLEHGFDVRIVELPAGSDPDDYIAREGGAAYARLLSEAPHYVEFLIRREAAARDLTRIDERAAAANVVLPHIARLGNAIERGGWAARLADTLGIEDSLVLQELSAAVRAGRPTFRTRPAGLARPPGDAEIRLVWLLIASDEARTECLEKLEDADLEGSRIKTVVAEILALVRAGEAVDAQRVLDRLDDDVERELFTRIAFLDQPAAGPTVEDCLSAFRRQRLKREKRVLTKEIGALDASRSTDEIDRHLLRLQELARQRDALS